MNIFRKFNATLARRPLLTQIVVSGAVSGGGDAFAQYLTNEPKWDYWRTARFTALAAVFITPPVFVWFRVLEKIRHSNLHVQTFGRMFCDQFAFSPIINGINLVELRLLEGLSFSESIDKLKEEWADVYFTSLYAWPALQLINFYFVPLNYRIILVQIISFFWNSWLSWKTQTPSSSRPLE